MRDTISKAPGHPRSVDLSVDQADRETVSRPVARWLETVLPAAADFGRSHGCLHVSAAYITDEGLRLGSFLRRARDWHAAGTLDRRIAQALDDIDPHWAAPDRPRRPHHAEAMLDAAHTFLQQHGHLRVPRDHKAGSGLNLGEWLRMRRRERRNGTLDPHLGKRIEALEAQATTNPSATARQPASVAEAVDELVAFHQLHGHVQVDPDHCTAGGLALGLWLAWQRHRYRIGVLDEQVATELEALGIVWPQVEPPREAMPDGVKIKPRDSSPWTSISSARTTSRERHIDAMYVFLEDEGHVDVRSSYVTADGLSLGRWLARQRLLRRNGELDPALEKELDALRVKWSRRPAGAIPQAGRPE